MAMDPRTHPRGAPPDFSMDGLPPNPNPGRITDALWWLAQMRLRLEPRSENGGILAIKPGYHSYGSRLPGAGPNGAGKSTTDHSIRRAPDRRGPWWEQFAAAHDWTFDGAHTGDYTEINLYMRRVMNAMRSLTDRRPDDVYAYVIGQLDGDRQVEGWNEYQDENESGDDSHLWHIHYSFRRNIVGDFWAMWKALTIDMGWTYAEWQQSIEEDDMPLSDDDIRRIWAFDPGDNQTGKTNGGMPMPGWSKPGDNATANPAWGVSRAVVGTDVAYQIRDRVDALAIALAKVLANVTADDSELQSLQAAITEAHEATVRDVLAGLGGAGRSDAELAAALRAALGDRAAAVGQLLAGA
jgi:hypothetical protein